MVVGLAREGRCDAVEPAVGCQIVPDPRQLIGLHVGTTEPVLGHDYRVLFVDHSNFGPIGLLQQRVAIKDNFTRLVVHHAFFPRLDLEGSGRHTQIRGITQLELVHLIRLI